MKIRHRMGLLSLCVAVLLVGLMGAVGAEEPPVYYSDPYPIEELYFGRDATYDEFLDEAPWWTYLYPNGNEDEPPYSFLIVWNEDDWDTGISGEADTFFVSGMYEPEREEWSDEELAQWEAGNIVVDPNAPPTVTVHRQPDDLVVIYNGVKDKILTRTVYPSATFEEAERILSRYTNLPQKEEPISPFLDKSMGFYIFWDKAQYETELARCIEAGETSFQLTGRYEVAESAYEGVAVAEGEPSEIVAIKQPPDLAAPEVYQYDWSDVPSVNVYIAPDTAFSALALPRTETLTLQGKEIASGYDLEFGVAWNTPDYEDAMAKGQDSFTVSGEYVPLPEWPPEVGRWWEEGRIRVAEDTPRPQLVVYLLRDGLPFTVAMQDHDAYLTPVFSFPWPNGAKLVTISMSFDKSTWYTVEVLWNESWEYAPAANSYDFYDEDGNLVSISSEAPRAFYAKLAVTGSAFAGETPVMLVSPDEDGNWNMTEDPGGDHGGGGQGEHDRPGKDEPDNPPPRPTPTPTPMPTPSPEPTPSPSPSQEPVPMPTPDPVPPASDPQEELAVAAIPPVQTETDPVPSADGGKTAHGSGAAQASQAPKPSQEPAPSPSEAITGEYAPETAPESQTPPSGSEPAVAPTASPMPTDSPQAPASHVPGFVWASAVTAAMVLGGAVWLRWRGKRK